MAEAVDSSEAWKAARVLRRLALSWEGCKEAAVPVGWQPPTERVAGAGPAQRAMLSHLPTLLREWWWLAGLWTSTPFSYLPIVDVRKACKVAFLKWSI